MCAPTKVEKTKAAALYLGIGIGLVIGFPVAIVLVILQSLSYAVAALAAAIYKWATLAHVWSSVTWSKLVGLGDQAMGELKPTKPLIARPVPPLVDSTAS